MRASSPIDQAAGFGNSRSRKLIEALSAIDLYWLPLGAGGHSVRLNGLVFEAIAARLQHRGRADLYHSALVVYVPEGRFVIEQAPAWGTSGERGVVAEGPVGIRAAGPTQVADRGDRPTLWAANGQQTSEIAPLNHAASP